ncbi:hypothetical protein BaRGS_00028896 [Batillaria attramentaria]|uniref:Uncharacterized protein n=1 Tax=Batillaria attramentaria TaxID=370345 RepID=A0ABD0JYI8_9CAEN
MESGRGVFVLLRSCQFVRQYTRTFAVSSHYRGRKIGWSVVLLHHEGPTRNSSPTVGVDRGLSGDQKQQTKLIIMTDMKKNLKSMRYGGEILPFESVFFSLLYNFHGGDNYEYAHSRDGSNLFSSSPHCRRDYGPPRRLQSARRTVYNSVCHTQASSVHRVTLFQRSASSQNIQISFQIISDAARQQLNNLTLFWECHVVEVQATTHHSALPRDIVLHCVWPASRQGPIQVREGVKVVKVYSNPACLCPSSV